MYLLISTGIMREILLEFDGISELVVILVESQTNAEFFWDNLSNMGRPADSIVYDKSPKESLHDFLILANRAKKLFDFDWDLSLLTQESFNIWHRDIELFDLSQHPPWSQDKGNLFIDLHRALHQAEPNNPNRLSRVRQSISVKWYGSSLPWPEVPNFECVTCQGDVVIDYPHVGKSPWISMLHNDNQNLKQSCKLADACPPCFIINLFGVNKTTQGKIINEVKSNQHSRLLEWYQANQDQLESMFTLEQMLNYHGQFCVGKIKDLSQLRLLQTAQLSTVKLV